jgi:hypothetical protein
VFADTARSRPFDLSFVRKTDHRPWPMPAAPWLITQSWHNGTLLPLSPDSSRGSLSSGDSSSCLVLTAGTRGDYDQYDGRRQRLGPWRSPPAAALRAASRRDRWAPTYLSRTQQH